MMHALKSPSFFRPSSRPSSPAPPASPLPRADSGVGLADRGSRSRNRLSLTTFRRPSPAPSLAPAPMTLIQDGSYLDALSLKLSEAVSKALAQPSGPANVGEVLSGRRPIPAGRGRAFGSLIASEINAVKDNAHLRRAVLRSLQRPLSVLMTNLSTDLLPLLSSTAFLTPPAPTAQAPNPNPTQAHALAVAAFAGEILETFDDLNLGLDADARGDGLKPIREGLTSVVNRVVNPLVRGIKDELVPLIESLEQPISSASAGVKASVRVTNQHASIVAMQTIMPVYSRALARYMPSPTSQTPLATLIISLIWRGLVALSHRPAINDVSLAPPSPPMGPLKKRTGSNSTTPPVTPPSSRFTMKLPVSRPPSPPNVTPQTSVAMDAHALYDLLTTLPRPIADNQATKIAREAVDEAFDGLKALIALLDAVEANTSSIKIDRSMELEQDIDVLTSGLPTLIALPVLLRAYVFGRNDGSSAVSYEGRSVASMLGLSEDEYRKGCLAGFGRAEECVVPVGQRVLDVLRDPATPVENLGPAADDVQAWLDRRISGDEN